MVTGRAPTISADGTVRRLSVVATERKVAEREVAGAQATDGRGPTLLRLLDELQTDLLSTSGPHLRAVVEAHLGRLAASVGASAAVIWRLGSASWDETSQSTAAEFEWPGAGDLTPPRHLLGAAFPLSEAVLAETGARVERGEVARWFGARVALVVPVTVQGHVARVITLSWPDAVPHEGLSGIDVDGTVTDVGLHRALSCFAATVHSAVELGAVIDRASYDDVAGLANRRLMLFMLGHLLARLGRNRGGGVAVILCPVVVEVGGQEGTKDPEPALMTRVARTLQRVTRATDLVASFDRRTLAVLCDDLPDDREALMVAERLHSALNEVLVGRRKVTARAVFGVGYTSEPVDAGVLLRRADQAAFGARRHPDRPVQICAT